MKIKSIVLLALSVAAGSARAKEYQPYKLDETISAGKFLNPEVEFRSVPFYSLNDELDPEVIKQHMKEFAQGGCGGASLHARVGLLTEYLGPEWWKAIDAGVEGAEANHIKAWFYDEDKWPSGYAGGKVPLMNPEFVSQCIVRLDKKSAGNIEGKTVVTQDENHIYLIDKMDMGQPGFNGTAYVDLMSEDVVKAFIETSYAPYAERYRSKIGSVAMGIFTDEPSISPRPNMSDNRGAIPYTPKLFDTFKTMHGYDLLPRLPDMFSDKEGYQKLRYDFRRTVAYLFEVNFAKQLADFCGQHNMIFQGHFKGENSPTTVAHYSGNNMTMYRHMQMPGMDILGLGLTQLNIPKSVSSVANQYGIPWRMSESYGIAGHNMSFEDRKWILDFLTNTGINVIVPHLALYSMKGERKRDYPPTFIHEPYWRYNKIFEDYSARMCYAMSTGRYAAQIAVVHPLESSFIELDPRDVNSKKVESRNPRNGVFDDVMKALQADHRDYDLADEQIMSEIARVGAEGLTIGEMSYKLVILPYMLTIRESTIKLLEELHRKGGTIIAVKQLPEYVDAVKNPARIESLNKISTLISNENLIKQLDKRLTPPFTLEGEQAGSIWTHGRISDVSCTSGISGASGGGYTIQLSNISRLDAIDATLRFNTPVKSVALWDPTNGKSYALRPGGDGSIPLHFAPTQTWIITTGDASTAADMKQGYSFRKQEDKKIAVISGEWQGERFDPNAITLDFASYSTDGGKSFSGSEPVIGIHRRLARRKYNGPLTLRYQVRSDIDIARCSLVVEQPQIYKSITANGKTADFSGGGYYTDHSLRTAAIALRKGDNAITMTLDYKAPLPSDLDAYKRYGTEIESIYITGDFGIEATASTGERPPAGKKKELPPKPVNAFSGFTLSAERKAFSGDLTSQGYPFYSGEFILQNSFEVGKVDPAKKYYVAFPSIDAIVVKVSVNGKEIADPIVYHPYEADVTGLLKPGNNTITVSVTNSLRNLMGPHHHKVGELTSVGPQSFSGESTWTSPEKGDSDWYNKRLKGEAKIWRDDYYMVPLGLLSEPVVVER